MFIPSAGLLIGALVLGSSLRTFRTPLWIRQMACAMLIADLIAIGCILIVSGGLVPSQPFLAPLSHGLAAVMILTAIYVSTRFSPADRR